MMGRSDLVYGVHTAGDQELYHRLMSAKSEDIAPFLDWSLSAQIEAMKGPFRAHIKWLWQVGIIPLWSLDQITDLKGADLSGADFSGFRMTRMDLSGADLRGATLKNTQFWGSNLKGARLGTACLRGADLNGADLTGADLSGADLIGASFLNAILQGALIHGAPMWVAKVYNLIKEGDPLLASDVLMAEVDNLFLKGEFDCVNALLDRIELDRLDTNMAVGLLCVTWPAADKLPDRPKLVERVRDHILKTETGERVARLLEGLK